MPFARHSGPEGPAPGPQRNPNAGKLISAACSVALGLIFIVRPGGTIESIVRMIGTVLLIGGVLAMIVFLLNRLAGPFVFSAGIVSIAAGIIFSMFPRLIVDFIPWLMGIGIIFSGITDLGHAINLSKFHHPRAGAMTITAILLIALGVLIFFHPGFIANSVIMVIGVVLLINGISDLAVYFQSGPRP